MNPGRFGWHCKNGITVHPFFIPPNSKIGQAPALVKPIIQPVFENVTQPERPPNP